MKRSQTTAEGIEEVQLRPVGNRAVTMSGWIPSIQLVERGLNRMGIAECAESVNRDEEGSVPDGGKMIIDLETPVYENAAGDRQETSELPTCSEDCAFSQKSESREVSMHANNPGGSQVSVGSQDPAGSEDHPCSADQIPPEDPVCFEEPTRFEKDSEKALQFDGETSCTEEVWETGSAETSLDESQSSDWVHKPLKDLIFKTNKRFYDIDSNKVRYKAGLSRRASMIPSLHRRKD